MWPRGVSTREVVRAGRRRRDREGDGRVCIRVYTYTRSLSHEAKKIEGRDERERERVEALARARDIALRARARKLCSVSSPCCCCCPFAFSRAHFVSLRASALRIPTVIPPPTPCRVSASLLPLLLRAHSSHLFVLVPFDCISSGGAGSHPYFSSMCFINSSRVAFLRVVINLRGWNAELARERTKARERALIIRLRARGAITFVRGAAEKVQTKVRLNLKLRL